MRKPSPPTIDRFRELVMALPEMIYEMDRHGRLTLFTHPERVGYTEETIRGLPALDLIAPEDRERCRSNIVTIMGGADLGFSSYMFRCRDGRTYPVLIHSSPLRRRGRLAGIRGVILDDTERWRLQRKLQEQEARWRVMLDAQPDAVLLVDPAGRVLAVNATAARRFGLTKEEARGQDLFATFPPAIAAARRRRLAESIRTRQAVIFEDTRDNRLFLNHFFPVIDPGGSVASVAIVAIDITGHRQAQTALELRAKQLETLFLISQEMEKEDGHLDDLLSRVVDIISRSCPVHGKRPVVLALHPRRFTAFQLDASHPVSEVPILAQGQQLGHLRLGSCGATPFGGAHSHPCLDNAFLGNLAERIARIHERRLAADRLNRRTEELIHSSRLAAIGEMATGVAHELNQPLCAIKTFAQTAAQLLGQPDGKAIVADNLQRIVQQVDRATRIMTEIRSLARKSEFQREPVDWPALVRQVLDFLAGSFQREGIEVVTAFPADPVRVSVEPLRLEQVLLNLLNNARDSVRGQPARRVGITVESLGGSVRTNITDSGTGFDPAMAEKLFHPFFTTKAPGEGTGLGLVISRRIVRDHGGTLTARGIPGGGATFTLTLPRLEEATHATG
ncbi:MAG: PAS domain S-box protein [Candidatus Riflebacteria bacterium]|nr:PAS domain S-box protein [Candidatus Riflebacteria bacterium]